MTAPISLSGIPRTRVDGRLKVTGAALYPSDAALANPAHAVLVTSAIAKGAIKKFHLERALAVPGVLDILTYENTKGAFKTPPNPGGATGGATTTLELARIWHGGQIVAVVVADSFEAASEAADLVQVDYASETPAAGFDARGAERVTLSEAQKNHKDPHVGDAESAFASAPVTIEAAYTTPAQHHNPMELFDTACFWTAGKLTIIEPSQFVHGLKAGVARQLGIDPDAVRVESRFVGGAFGSRGGVTARTALIALAAKRVNRPVRLVATRAQGFTIATFRAETRHSVKLGATSDGKLQSVIHEADEVSSRPANYNVSGTETTASMYACPNVSTKVRIVHADRNTPGFMRAPPETPYMFALESAMDELAVALNMDPVTLRRLNDTHTDPIKNIPFSSRSLIACLDRGSRVFGWEKRVSAPQSMRDGDWMIGYGMASSAYPAHVGAAAARLTVEKESARVQLAAHEIGTGTETIIAGIVADRLHIPIERVEVVLGDTDLPPAGMAAGSTHAASVCNAVAKACDEAAERLRAHNQSPSGVIEVYAEYVPDGAGADALKKLYAGQPSMVADPKHLRYAFGAQFAEVRIHHRTREIRVPRLVGAFAAGAIINPVTARSQLMGGMIWGVSAALFEATEIDRATARYTNTNYADYLIPVNADIGTVDVLLVPEEDHVVNDLGIKGVGELGIVGMNAAIANAVYHATGTRVRELPIRIEKLLEPRAVVSL